MPSIAWRIASLLVAFPLLGVLPGCSPREYREQADEAAYEIIHEQQAAAFGRDEDFTIERPAGSLRRALLVEQQLPRAAPASLGAGDVELIPEWPEASYLDSARPSQTALEQDVVEDLPPAALQLTLEEALQVGARNSRDYQDQKELVFQTALQLDLAREEFRSFFTGFLEGEITRDLGLDPPESGARGSAGGTVTRQLKNGMTFAASLGVDLVKLLTQDRSSSLGVFGDASISVPLLRGSGEFVVTEPLKQAERNVVYVIYQFERFKREFAVRLASDYLGVLQQLDQVRNAEENYRNLIRSRRRAQRLADAGRLPEIQVDQARQDELSARNRWISAQQGYDRALDRFKTLLGLPTDAAIALDPTELERLAALIDVGQGDAGQGDAGEPDATPAEPGTDGAAGIAREAGDPQRAEDPGAAGPGDPGSVSADAEVVLDVPSDEGAGPLELNEGLAVGIALLNRLDLRVTLGRIHDAQRGVAVAADNLRADLTLLGVGSAGSGRSVGSGSAGLSDSGLRPERGRYSAFLTLDLPLERTLERNEYRNSIIAFEQVIRDLQALEDQIKLEVRDGLRTLLEARESLRIQSQAVRIARRRVESTNLFLQAGRAEIRDLLEAEEDLVSARNALTAARVQYRVSELELQRDLGVLQVDAAGLWHEFRPETSSTR